MVPITPDIEVATILIRTRFNIILETTAHIVSIIRFLNKWLYSPNKFLSFNVSSVRLLFYTD